MKLGPQVIISGFPVGGQCGVVGESHWWGVWWAAGLVGNLVGLVGVGLVLEFPCSGAGVYGASLVL